jgi:hypothetical protein
MANLKSGENSTDKIDLKEVIEKKSEEITKDEVPLEQKQELKP